LYLDLDVGCGGSVDTFLTDPTKVYMINIWAEDDGTLSDQALFREGNNWMIACRRGHPTMWELAELGLRNALNSPVRTVDGVASIAGPRFMGRFAQDRAGEFVFIGSRYVSEFESIQNVAPPDKPILVHLGEHTWNSQAFSWSRTGDARDFHPL